MAGLFEAGFIVVLRQVGMVACVHVSVPTLAAVGTSPLTSLCPSVCYGIVMLMQQVNPAFCNCFLCVLKSDWLHIYMCHTKRAHAAIINLL